jgi:hypothetical protein
MQSPPFQGGVRGGYKKNYLSIPRSLGWGSFIFKFAGKKLVLKIVHLKVLTGNVCSFCVKKLIKPVCQKSDKILIIR